MYIPTMYTDRYKSIVDGWGFKGCFEYEAIPVPSAGGPAEMAVGAASPHFHSQCCRVRGTRMFFLWQVWVENRLSEVSVLVLNFSFGAGLAEDSEGIFRPRGQYQCPSSHGGVKGHRCNRRFCRLSEAAYGDPWWQFMRKRRTWWPSLLSVLGQLCR